MPKSVRILLAAGGTGGHLFPGVAVAEYMERNLGASVLFLGTKGGIEKSIVPRLGFHFGYCLPNSFEAGLVGEKSGLWQ